MAKQRKKVKTKKPVSKIDNTKVNSKSFTPLNIRKPLNTIDPITERPDFEGNFLSRTAAGGVRTDVRPLRDLFNYYGGLPLKDKILKNSAHTPTNSKDKNAKYISIDDTKFKQKIISQYTRVFKDKDTIHKEVEQYNDKRINGNTYRVSGYRPNKEGKRDKDAGLGRYFVSKGEDEKGKYASYYDVFDTGQPNSGMSFGQNIGEKLGAVKPFEVYDRIYEKDFDSINNIKDDNMATKRRKIPTSKVPKHVWGAVISGATSLIGGAIAAKNQRKLEAEQFKTAQGIQKGIDQDLLDEYPEEGNLVEGYYKKGGKMYAKGGDSRYIHGGKMGYKAKGGDLKAISSDTVLAQGNKHNESTIDNTSGIKLLQGDKAVAEVEDGEVIKDNHKVFSDALQYRKGTTYAEAAEILGKRKGKIEKGMQRGNKISANTAKRKLAILDKTEDALFAKQEQSKVGTHMENPNGIPKGEEGFDLNKVVPYIDNVVNLGLTAMTPKINKPNLQKAANLDTTVNVSPQLSSVRKAVDAGTQRIMTNTSSSASARNEANALSLRGADATSGILAQKENAETQLRNRNKLNKQQVTASNLAKLDRFDDKNLMRSDDIQGRLSANVADAVGDHIDRRNFEANIKFQDEQLDIARQYSTSGTAERADLLNPTEVAKLQSDPEYAERQYKRYANNPKLRARLDIILGRNTVPQYITPQFNLGTNQYKALK